MATLTTPRERLAKQFRALDRDGSGYLTGEDYELTARDTLEEFGVDPESAAGQTLIREYVALWERMRAKVDSDDDGRVSLDEFLASVTESMDRGHFAQAITPVVRAIMTVCDTDGDGAISRDEFVRWMVVVGGPRAESEEVARRVDSDGDGQVSFHEFLAIIEDFYCGTDPESASNLVFGR